LTQFRFFAVILFILFIHVKLFVFLLHGIMFNLLILHFIEMEKIQLFKNACRCQHGYLYDPR
jgi:hypothetical protein